MFNVNKCLLLIASIGLISPVFADSISESESMYILFGVGKSNLKAVKNSKLPIVTKIGYESIIPNDNEFGVDFKRGINYRAAIGYKKNNFRGELELSYLRSKYKNFTEDHGRTPLLFSSNLSGYVRATPLMINGYFDWESLNKWVVPYLGVGAGLFYAKNHIELGGQVTVHADGVTTSPAAASVGNMTDRKLALQGIVGVMINLHEKIAAVVDYRYFSTTKLKALDKRFQNQSINVGLMYRF